MASVTFSRKSRSGDKPGVSSDASTAASTYMTAPSVLTPVQESPGVDQDENCGGGAATSTAKSGAAGAGGNGGQPAPRWRRKNAAERQDVERRQHLAEMRAYFQEVDAFELAVETPPASKPQGGRSRPAAEAQTPPTLGGGAGQQGGVARALAAAAPTPGTAVRQRAMSLGLSRRRSSAVAWPLHTALASSSKAAYASPLKLSMRLGAQQEAAAQQERSMQPGGGGSRRSTLQPQPQAIQGTHRLSVAADNSGMVGSPGGGASGNWAVSRHSLAMRGRRSSVAPSRLSGTGKMLSRLSVGLTDALQWLGIKGKIPAAAGEEGEEAQHLGAAGAAGAGRPALSPIASPGMDEEGGNTSADDSPQPVTSMLAVTALEQQPVEEADVSAASSSPVPAIGDQVAGLGREEEETAAEGVADAAAVEQLEVQLATKLQLQSTAEEDEEEQGQEEEEAGDEAEQQLAAAAEAAQQQQQQQRLDDLAAASEGEEAEEEEAEEELTPLQQLLQLCGQETDPELLPSMDELLGQHVDLRKVRKIGEGTFGEAFKAAGVVLKIVPMAGSILVNGEPQKRADEILAEVAVTLTLSRLNGAGAEPGEAPANVTSGFVETFGVGICAGGYSPALCKEWHRWDKENESENEPVDVFKGAPDQLFVVFVVADGGVDLEHFELRSFQEVRSILLQTALTVAVGEEACQFEHRDLHWGNLLIRRSEQPAATSAVRARLRGVELEAATEGVTVTLIDFTLSRLVTVTGEVAFCDLAADPELFRGPKNSVQAETYRRMKRAMRNGWEAHVPATNVFWMQYLVDTCITEKKGWGCGKNELAALRAFKRRASAAASCSDLLLDEFLRGGLMIDS